MNKTPASGVDPAPRTVGVFSAMRNIYERGMVFHGQLDRPTIDHRQYMERELDMHNVHQSFAVRKRVMERMGNSDMMVIWFTDTMPGVPKASQSLEAIQVMDQWMRNIRANPKAGIRANRPPGAVDSCFDVEGKLIYRGDDAWDGILDDKPAGVCTQRFPLYQTARIVAGAPIEGGIYRCALKPVEQAVMDGTYAPWTPSAADVATLKKIFPTGVCDYSKPDTARPALAPTFTWLRAVRALDKATHPPQSHSPSAPRTSASRRCGRRCECRRSHAGSAAPSSATAAACDRAAPIRRLAPPADEPPGAVVAALDPQAPFMHRAVMEAAQRDEVGQLRRTTLGPMLDVVAVDVALVGAAREHTATIARAQSATQRRRDAAGLACHVERLALRILEDAHDAAVTGEAPGRLHGQCRTVLQLATAGLTGVQRLEVDVHDDLVALTAVQRGGPLLQETLRDDDERICTSCRV